VNLPEYDPTLTKHKALVELVEQAHQEHDSTKRANIVAKVRAAAAEIIEAEIALRQQ
jgi:hypothetical protein